MDHRLKEDIDHYFSVFRNNVEEDLHKIFRPTPLAIGFQAKFEEELEDFRAALMDRLQHDCHDE